MVPGEVIRGGRAAWVDHPGVDLHGLRWGELETAGRADDELVFTSPAGEVLRNNNFRRRVFDRAAESVGLAGVTPHELRHTAASLAVAEGANVKAVQRMLGHVQRR